ncbi:MAG: PP2C family protein-serine/threonine phosphatase [Ruminiclostridium sp.]|nr:PP2C family protein-serine/threonine phosphatase [Ruminiclostridium sp.]
MKTTKGFYLTTKYLAIAGAFLVLVSATLGITLANLADRAIKSLISSWMLDIANTAAALLDGDVCRDVSPENEGEPGYEAVMKTLTGFQYSMDMSYIYLVQDKGDNNFVFGLDPTIEDYDDFGTPVAYTDALYTASKGTPAASLTAYKDAWGWFYSAYSPVFDSEGNVASIVTVDFSKEWYDEQVLSLTMTTVIVIALSLAVGAAVVIVFGHKYKKSVKVVSRQLDELEDKTEHMAAELRVATKIQADMLPKDFPKNDRIELYAAMTPAKEVGGDFYDFFFTDDDHIALVMADVSGKGVPAAMFCVVAKAIIRDKAMLGGDPASILFDVNNILCQNNNAGFFITVWLGILDLKTGVVEYVNAGHEYPIVGAGNSSVSVIKRENCPPLAAAGNTEFINETLTLAEDDTLFLYTDGVTEAKATDGERFGMSRLVGSLERSMGSSPEKIVTELKREVDDFQPANDPFDDVTIMSVVRRSSGKRSE